MGVTRGFKDVTTPFAMTESSHASTKTKGVIETIWYLHSKGVNAFIQQIKVGVMCGNNGGTS
jgi:hypothetical protein